MINYKEIALPALDNQIIDNIYSELLLNKWQFVIITVNGKLRVLTKEKSLFEIDDELEFLNLAKEDIYYKTIFTELYSIQRESSKMIDKYGAKKVILLSSFT